MPEGEKEKAEFLFPKEEKEPKKESPQLTLVLNTLIAILIVGAVILALVLLLFLFFVYVLPMLS